MRFRNLLAAASVGAAMLAASAVPASATALTFSILGGGGDVTLNNGPTIDSALTTSKTLAPIEFVGFASGDPGAAAAAGLAFLTPVTFSTLTLNTTNGPFAFTVTAGNLVLSFTQVANANIASTTANKGGTISEDFVGTVTGDTSIGTLFLGQTVSFSESCNQAASAGAPSVISCTDTVNTPSSVRVPEPMSIALLGSGLLASGAAFRRRRKPAAKQA